MAEIRKPEETHTLPVKEDLSSILNEISFSYSVASSTKTALDDLDQSIQELGMLVDYLEEKAKTRL